jgi:hypothetical protein
MPDRPRQADGRWLPDGCYLPMSATCWNAATLPIKSEGEVNDRRIGWCAPVAARFITLAAAPLRHEAGSHAPAAERPPLADEQPGSHRRSTLLFGMAPERFDAPRSMCPEQIGGTAVGAEVGRTEARYERKARARVRGTLRPLPSF